MIASVKSFKHEEVLLFKPESITSTWSSWKYGIYHIYALTGSISDELLSGDRADIVTVVCSVSHNGVLFIAFIGTGIEAYRRRLNPNRSKPKKR